MAKITVRDKDSGETVQFDAPVNAETLAAAFSDIFDRSFAATAEDDGKKMRIEVRDKDSGQEWMTIRDIAIVLGRTRKGVYKLIGSDAKKTAKDLNCKPLPIRRIPGSKEYGCFRTEFFAWLKASPRPVRIEKVRRGRPRKK